MNQTTMDNLVAAIVVIASVVIFWGMLNGGKL